MTSSCLSQLQQAAQACITSKVLSKVRHIVSGSPSQGAPILCQSCSRVSTEPLSSRVVRTVAVPNFKRDERHAESSQWDRVKHQRSAHEEMAKMRSKRRHDGSCPDRLQNTWVVVKVMVPFWVPQILGAVF